MDIPFYFELNLRNSRGDINIGKRVKKFDKTHFFIDINPQKKCYIKIKYLTLLNNIIEKLNFRVTSA